MKLLGKLFLTTLLTMALKAGEDGWITIFDGKSLDAWKSNNETPGVFTLEDGVLKVDGGRAHLFYMGKDGKASFKDFIVKLKVKTSPQSNSGFYFHTEYQSEGWPGKGFECQLNSTHSDPRKTGSLYAVKDVMNDAPSEDGKWFEYEIEVKGKKVTVKVDGKIVTEWTQPDDWKGPDKMEGRVLSSGTFAIQGHDPGSVTYIKDIEVKPLD